MKKEELLHRLNHFIAQGRNVLATKQYSQFSGDYVNFGLQMGFKTGCLSFLKNLYGEEHPYYKNFNNLIKGDSYSDTENGINILLAIQNEIENDWLISLKQLVSAEIFSDFLEMSKYLLDNNFKDASAVMIGSVLEENLRLFCQKFAIETTIIKGNDIIPKKADLLNSDLVKAGAYGVLEQKNVTAWLDLRNRAAHGKYSEYSKEQVDLMYLGVLNFITTFR